MRSAAVAIAVVALALAGGCGGEGAVLPSPTPLPPPTVHVDPRSTGGPCDDERQVALVDDPARPWCTLERAFEEAPGGAVVILHGARHPNLDLEGLDRSEEPLVIRAAEGEGVSIDGMTIDDSSGLRFEDLRLTGRVLIREGSRDIALVRNELTDAGVWILGAQRVRLEGNAFHDLRAGDEEGSMAVRIAEDDGEPAADVVVRGNRLERLPDDAVQLTGAERVLVEGNLIRDVHPGGFGEHADAVQVIGGRGLTIRGNEIRDVEHGMLFTDAEARDVVIENNLVAGVTGGLGLKTEGTYGMPGLVVRHNTWADTEFGVQFRAGYDDALVVNNIFDHVDGLANQPGASRNLVAEERDGFEYGDDVILEPPVYEDPEAFRLAAGSPGVDAGTAEGATERDRLGRPRTDDPETPDSGVGEPPYVDVGAQERIPG